MAELHPPTPTVRLLLFVLCNVAIVLYGFLLTSLGVWILAERSRNLDNSSVPVISIVGLQYGIILSALGFWGITGKHLSSKAFFWYTLAGLVVAAAEVVTSIVLVTLTFTDSMTSPAQLLWQELHQDAIATIQSKVQCCGFEGGREGLEARDMPWSCLNTTTAQLHGLPHDALHVGNLTFWKEGCRQTLEKAVSPTLWVLVSFLVVLRAASLCLAGDMAIRVTKAERATRQHSMTRPAQPAAPECGLVETEPPGPSMRNASLAPVCSLQSRSQALSRPTPRGQALSRPPPRGQALSRPTPRKQAW